MHASPVAGAPRYGAAVSVLVAISMLAAGRLSAQQCVVFGPYASSPAVSYSCGSGLISFNYSSWIFIDMGGGNIRIIGSPSGTPPHLVGSLNCTDSSFSATVTLSGSCTETYRLQGRFTSDTSWSGTFSATFIGSGCGGSGCFNQSFPVSGTTTHVTTVSGPVTPGETLLQQNFPNPFNPSTRIRFSLTLMSAVDLEIFDCLGRHVATLVHAQLPAGPHEIEWNPLGLPGGVYWYRLRAGELVRTRSLVFLP